MPLHLHYEYIKFCSLEQCSFELKELFNYWTKLDQLSLFSFFYCSMNSAGLCMTDYLLNTYLNKSMVHRQKTVTHGTKFQHEVV